MKKQRCLVLTLCMLLALALLAACAPNEAPGAPPAGTGGSTGEATPDDAAAEGEMKTLRYLVVDWGTSSADQDMVMEAVNKKLLADGMDFQVSIEGLTFDSWEQKTNLMLTTNEPFDALLVMNDVIPLTAYMARNAIQPITPYLEEYGQNLKQMIPEASWAAVTSDGEVWGIPGSGTPYVSVNEWITYRKDWIDEYYGKEPATNDELLEASQAVYDSNPGEFTMAWPKPSIPNTYLHRDYDTYPFTVVDEMIYVDQEGNAKPWIETEEFKKDCEFMRTMMERGQIHPDLLTLDPEVRSNYILGMPGEPEIGFSWAGEISIWSNGTFKQNVPDGELSVGLLAPDKPLFNDMGILHAQVVPAASENPELAVRFFDWLYSDQANHDLLLWGIEGTHWQKSDATLSYEGIERPVIEILRNEQGEPGYVSGGMWMYGNLNLKSYTSEDSPYAILIDNPKADAVNSVVIGFVFDSTPVSEQYVNLQAEIQAVVWPLRLGVISYDEGFAAMQDRLNAAGLQDVVAEYQSQLTEYLNG